MKEKEIKAIANSVQRVWLRQNEALEWAVHFGVSYQEEVEKLTSYYGGADRTWLDLNAALKTVRKLFPKVGTVELILYSGEDSETVDKDP